MSMKKHPVQWAWERGTVVPAFNVPYLPMMESIVRALRDTNTLGLIAVARPEWIKFEAVGVRAVFDLYEQMKAPDHTHLHLDHVPVIDEDDQRVDYEAVVREALELGYESVMVDGSRLTLDENIAVSRDIVTMAHERGVLVEAELGAVLGHEEGPLPPYEALFASGRGFTDPSEAGRFVAETGVDWLSVAVGNVHGAISRARRDEKKVAARLQIEHLDKIQEAAQVPLVLHGGSGIHKESVLAGVRHGIAKINIATTIRQPYEQAVTTSVEAGQTAVYETMLDLIHNELEIAGSAAAYHE